MLNLVQTRIKPLFDQIGSAVNVRTAMEQRIARNNAAFVVPVRERPLGNSREADIGNPLQEVVVTFGVVVGLRITNDPTGEKAIEQQEVLRTSLRQQLYGWKPSSEYEPVLLGDNDLIGFAPDGMWWIDRFTTNTWFEGV